MVLLDNLFSRKPSPKKASPQDAGPTSLPTDAGQSMDRKSLRLEKRELLYAVVRESMARVGMLSSSYKYKVLSLDSRGSQYLIMMDLPLDMASQIGQLNEIEEIIKENASLRHQIEVTAVYWRINQKPTNVAVLKSRPVEELASNFQNRHEPVFSAANPALKPGAKQRYEPIRADEVKAFKQALDKGVRPTQHKDAGRTQQKAGQDFARTEFPATEFEETQMQEEDPTKNLPLSRTQYGDLI